MYGWLEARVHRGRFTMRRVIGGVEEVYDSVMCNWRRRSDVGLSVSEYQRLGAVEDFEVSEAGPWQSDLLSRPSV